MPPHPFLGPLDVAVGRSHEQRVQPLGVRAVALDDLLRETTFFFDFDIEKL